jgi:hypothetical protein
MYSHETFPPTDFHTATLVGDEIIIIGCLGYMKDRQRESTPVYILDCNSMKIRLRRTYGEGPGWINHHTTKFLPEENALQIEGGKNFDYAEQFDIWRLDLGTFFWENCTNRNWMSFEIRAKRGTRDGRFVSKAQVIERLAGRWVVSKPSAGLDFFEGVYELPDDKQVFLHHSFGSTARVVFCKDASKEFKQVTKAVRLCKDLFEELAESELECRITQRPKWNLQTHRYYSAEFNDLLVLLLLINTRLECPLPKDIWLYRIFGQLAKFDPPGFVNIIEGELRVCTKTR